MRLTRAPLIDFMVIRDESLVMTENQCLRLAAVPTALLVYLDQPEALTRSQSTSMRSSVPRLKAGSRR